MQKKVLSSRLSVRVSIICEAATVGNAHVVLTNDRFIQNMIKYQPVYHSSVKAIERVFNLKFVVYQAACRCDSGPQFC